MKCVKLAVCQWFCLVAWLGLSGCASSSGPSRVATKTESMALLSADEQQNWRRDIHFLNQQLAQRHIHLYHSVGESDWQQAVSQLQANLGNLNRYQLKVELMRLLRMVGDGHTALGWWGEPYYRFPFQVRWFGQQLKLSALPKRHQRHLGATLVALNNIPLNEVIAGLAPILPYVENPYSLRQRTRAALPVADLLFALDISDLSKVTLTLEDAKQQRTSLVLESARSKANAPLVELQKPLSGAASLLAQQDIALGNEGLALRLLPQQHTAYLDFRDYPSYWRMFWFAKKMAKRIAKGGYRNLIIDMRENGGGNFFVGLLLLQFLQPIDSLDWRKGIYVLVGNKTFSAAMNNAVHFKQMLNATVVGTPTGGNPFEYQDASTFYLPHSGWPVSVSKRLFKLQANKSMPLQPDVVIDNSWQDFLEGRDPQLEWVLADIANRR